jgi:hypothetical protein
MPNDRKPTREVQIISVSTVLILSAFLIGLAVGNVIGTELEPYVLACGLAGMLAFLGLELAAYHRKVLAIEEEKQRMEERLARHVLSQSAAAFTLPPVTAKPLDEVTASVA